MTPDKAQVRNTLKEFFGYDSFKSDQEDVIMHLIGGGDAFVLMPTGGGKSLCYQLPALVMEGTAIVISPLIALMKNQVDLLRGFDTGTGSVAHFLNSSLNRMQMEEVRADLLAGKTKILYVAPETLTKDENVNLLRGVKISFYAVDEAHCISEWGHDFRPEYRRIRTLVESIGRAPIIALTATATPKVQLDHSILAAVGKAIAWIFIPLGWGNWQAAVASITGLVAKENIVGTMGVLYGGGENSVYAALGNAFNAASGYSFLAFNLLCAPCFAAIGAIKREMNNAKWTWFAIGYQCVFAYLVAFICNQLGAMLASGAKTNVIGIILAIAILAFAIYMLVRPYKEATKLEKEVKVSK